jgi:hypothetical protein
MFVVVFDEGRDPGVDVSKADFNTWVTSIKVPFSALRDPDITPLKAQSVLGAKETSYILDRRTRGILAQRTEATGGTVAALDDLP